MWMRINYNRVRQVDATHLENPKNSGSPMLLHLFQTESATLFFTSKSKKLFAEYQETPAGTRIARRRWTPKMKAFAEEEISKTPRPQGGVRITILGWVFLLSAIGLLGYLSYEGLQAPAKQERYQQVQEEKAVVSEGDVYFGNYRIYKEKGNVIGSEGGFGWFKVIHIEGDTYDIAFGTEISKTVKPKEAMNSTDFAAETHAVKAKVLEAYMKQFVSEDGLTEINLNEKKE